MTRKLTTLFAAATILGGLAAATTVFAEENAPTHGIGTTNDHRGMMNMTGQMDPGQMKQMTRMFDNCNRMMESLTTSQSGPNKDQAPGHQG